MKVGIVIIQVSGIVQTSEIIESAPAAGTPSVLISEFIISRTKKKG